MAFCFPILEVVMVFARRIVMVVAFVVVCCCMQTEASARIFGRRNGGGGGGGGGYMGVPAGHSNATAQGVANIQAATGRMGHYGGNPGYEGCAVASTPQQALATCCYANSGMPVWDQGVAQGANGMWYACKRYGSPPRGWVTRQTPPTSPTPSTASAVAANETLEAPESQ